MMRRSFLNVFAVSAARKLPHLLCNAIAVFVLVAVTHQASDAQDGRRRSGGGVTIGGAGIIGAIIQNEINRQQTQPQQRRRVYVPKQTYRRAKTVRTRSVSPKRPQRRYARRRSTETAAVYATPQPKPSPVTIAPQAAAAPIIGPAAPVAAALISTPSEITAAQQHLKFMGYDVPDTSGALDLKTKIAVMQFQESIGATTTGEMTMDQLQTLFQKAAAQSAKTK